MRIVSKDRSGEHGGAGLKFIIVLIGFILTINAGIQYVPVAYNAESLLTEMQTAILQGMSMPAGKLNPIDNVKERIRKAMVSNDIPADAYVSVTQKGNVIQARVAYTKPVAVLPFGIYTYHYTFDHTATPTGFLLKQ